MPRENAVVNDCSRGVEARTDARFATRIRDDRSTAFVSDAVDGHTIGGPLGGRRSWLVSEKEQQQINTLVGALRSGHRHTGGRRRRRRKRMRIPKFPWKAYAIGSALGALARAPVSASARWLERHIASTLAFTRWSILGAGAVLSLCATSRSRRRAAFPRPRARRRRSAAVRAGDVPRARALSHRRAPRGAARREPLRAHRRDPARYRARAVRAAARSSTAIGARHARGRSPARRGRAGVRSRLRSACRSLLQAHGYVPTAPGAQRARRRRWSLEKAHERSVQGAAGVLLLAFARAARRARGRTSRFSPAGSSTTRRSCRPPRSGAHHRAPQGARDAHDRPGRGADGALARTARSIEEYAVAVFESWKLGQKGKDNGVLLVIVPPRAQDAHRSRLRPRRPAHRRRRRAASSVT